jgi:hypothetical protein
MSQKKLAETLEVIVPEINKAFEKWPEGREEILAGYSSEFGISKKAILRLTMYGFSQRAKGIKCQY